VVTYKLPVNHSGFGGLEVAYWLLVPKFAGLHLSEAVEFLTCICLSSRLFRVTLEIPRAECSIDVTPGTLTATDTCIGYHVTRFEASRKVILHTRYVNTCVGAGGGRGRGTKIKTKANRCGAYYLKCDKYKSSLRHIHDPVLLSLKMKGICLLFFRAKKSSARLPSEGK
jgi:hypothetical protein